MKLIKVILAIGMSILLSASLVAPVSAAVWYNPDTNQFEERDATASRGGSPIRKQIVDYQTSQKPGTIIIETGERRLYAYGHADGSWSKARNAQWESIRVRSLLSYHKALYEDYFCPDGINVRNAKEAVERLRRRVN